MDEHGKPKVKEARHRRTNTVCFHLDVLIHRGRVDVNRGCAEEGWGLIAWWEQSYCLGC